MLKIHTGKRCASWGGYVVTLEDDADIPSDLKSKLATFITDFGSEDSEDKALLTHCNALQASRIY